MFAKFNHYQRFDPITDLLELDRDNNRLCDYALGHLVCTMLQWRYGQHVPQSCIIRIGIAQFLSLRKAIKAGAITTDDEFIRFTKDILDRMPHGISPDWNQFSLEDLVVRVALDTQTDWCALNIRIAQQSLIPSQHWQFLPLVFQDAESADSYLELSLGIFAALGCQIESQALWDAFLAIRAQEYYRYGIIWAVTDSQELDFYDVAKTIVLANPEIAHWTGHAYDSLITTTQDIALQLSQHAFGSPEQIYHLAQCYQEACNSGLSRRAFVEELQHIIMSR